MTENTQVRGREMRTVQDYKAAIQLGVNVIATVAYVYQPEQKEVIRIGPVVKIQGKEYAVKYGGQPNERFWLRFPLVREVESIEGSKITYTTWDKKRGVQISRTTVEIAA